MAFVFGAPFLFAAATTVTAIGTYQQIQAQRQQAKTERAMYEYNAKVRMQQAAQTRRASLEEQRIRRRDLYRLLKTRRAAYGKAGVTMAGSPMAVQLRLVEDVTEDISRVTETYRMETRRLTSAAGLELYKAKAAKRAGKIGVGTALLGGVSDLAMMGLSYKLATA